MVDNAFKQPIDGLAFITTVEGKSLLNVVGEGKLYRFNIPVLAVSRLASEATDAVRSHLHTLPTKEK